MIHVPLACAVKKTQMGTVPYAQVAKRSANRITQFPAVMI